MSTTISNELIRVRRDLHKHPESGWLEYRTSSKIADVLENFGFEVYVGEQVCDTETRMGVPCDETLLQHEKRALSQGANPKWIEQMKGGKTGVVGVHKSAKPGPIIALRFDIDALNLNESSSKVHIPALEGFRSVHEGMMHACGHDGHAAIGLGVAQFIMKHKAECSGEIRLLFQPAEEGCRGAKSMVDKGWLDHVDFFYSGHIAFQSFQLGEVVASVGGFLSTTKLDVTFKGLPAHAGKTPEIGKNALLAAATASLHLHGIPRHGDGISRINVGLLKAGSGRNIVPDHATMAIETRGETSKINDYMTEETIRIIKSAAYMHDVECEWKIVGKAPGSTQNEIFSSFIQDELKSIKGLTTVLPYRELNASEDVVYMMNKVHSQGGEASYLLFGSPIPAGHHESLFDFNEEVLTIGVNVLTRLIFASKHWDND